MFAVVDFETTGILPSYHHRVIEIGVTHVDDDGMITGRWETLVNPRRDLGAQRIHGIRSADILDAPAFEDIAPDFAGLLQGRVFAAHNANFDLRFLRAEFERAGYLLTEVIPSVCTMRLGGSFGLGGGASLLHACGTLGIDHAHAHSAGHDSHVTAQLLSHYRRASAAWPGWNEYWEQTSLVGRSYSYPAVSTTGVTWKTRAEASAGPISFLERISTDAARETVDGAEVEYLALLDRCLLDGHISVSEGAQLAEVAAELGLPRSAIDTMHVDYYRALVHRAWADGILTDDERLDLASVAELLQIPADAAGIDHAPAHAVGAPQLPAFTLDFGDMIVLTGEMSRERPDWEAELRARGFVPHPGITKKVKLLVSADPDSLSGKARKAREYDIPIVDEAGLVRLLRASTLATLQGGTP